MQFNTQPLKLTGKYLKAHLCITVATFDVKKRWKTRGRTKSFQKIILNGFEFDNHLKSFCNHLKAFYLYLLNKRFYFILITYVEDYLIRKITKEKLFISITIYI